MSKYVYCHWVAGVLVLGALTLVALPARAADKDSKPDTAKGERVRGRIIDVRPDDNQLTVRTRKGEEVKLTVDSDSRLQLNGADAKLSQFKPGMRVVVHYTVKDGRNEVVSMSEPRITLAKVQQEINEALTAAKAYTYQQKAEYEKKLKEVARNLDHQIEELEDKVEDAKPEIKKEYAKMIEELRHKREALQEKIVQVAKAAPEMWDELKTKVNAAIDEVQRAIEQARSDMKKSAPPKEP